jgi:hypothetical protein
VLLPRCFSAPREYKELLLSRLVPTARSPRCPTVASGAGIKPGERSTERREPLDAGDVPCPSKCVGATYRFEYRDLVGELIGKVEINARTCRFRPVR